MLVNQKKNGWLEVIVLNCSYLSAVCNDGQWVNGGINEPGPRQKSEIKSQSADVKSQNAVNQINNQQRGQIQAIKARPRP